MIRRLLVPFSPAFPRSVERQRRSLRGEALVLGPGRPSETKAPHVLRGPCLSACPDTRRQWQNALAVAMRWSQEPREETWYAGEQGLLLLIEIFGITAQEPPQPRAMDYYYSLTAVRNGARSLSHPDGRLAAGALSSTRHSGCHASKPLQRMRRERCLLWTALVSPAARGPGRHT